jgi:hypothetical protein
MNSTERGASVRADVAQLLHRLPEHDLVVGMLRYGAHLPHLCELDHDIPLLLSHMVAFEERSFYAEKRIVLLDDTIYRGTEMSRLWTYFVEQLGVPRESLVRAVVVVHAGSEYQPEIRIHTLKDADYIVWKESLASTIRGDIRPTERDYPLYYFDTTVPIGRLLSILGGFGTLHAASADGAADVFRTTLVVNANALAPLKSCPGLSIEDICQIKLHYYTDHITAKNRLVVIPMAFCRLSVPEFFSGGGDQVLARVLELPRTFYYDVLTSNCVDPQAFVYYLVSRSLCAVLLRSLLARVVPRLGNGSLTSLDPVVIDGHVRYRFPAAYEKFHGVVREMLPLTSSTEQLDLVDVDHWALPLEERAGKLKADPIIPASYQITQMICSNAAQTATASLDQTGISHRELFKAFNRPTFVARALDDLIDSGLLRAVDAAVDVERTVWDRQLYTGGEFKAAEVHTLADAWAIEPDVSDEVVREELAELWGPF